MGLAWLPIALSAFSFAGALQTLPLTRSSNQITMSAFVGGPPAWTVPQLVVDTGTAGFVVLQTALSEALLAQLPPVFANESMFTIVDNDEYGFGAVAHAQFNLSLVNSTSVSSFVSLPLALPLLLESAPYSQWMNTGYENCDGLFGLRPSPGLLSLFQSSFALPSLPVGYRLQFSSPWRPSATQSLSIYESINEYPTSATVWSEPLLNSSVTTGVSFTVYNFGVCGIPSGLNYSSNLIGTVNTSSSCLTLPSQLYDAAIAWLPIVCSLAVTSAETTPACVMALHLNTTLANTPSLPLLSFQLSANGSIVYIDLMDLVIGDNATAPVDGHYVCLLRGESLIVANSAMTPAYAPIVFGSFPLRSFDGVIVDVNGSRLGMTTTLSSSTTSLKSCKRAVHCIGEQSYYPPGNTCISPRCSDFLFQQLEVPSQTCGYTVGFRSFAVLIASMIVVLEAAGIIFRRRLDSLIEARPAHQFMTEPRQGDEDDTENENPIPASPSASRNTRHVNGTIEMMSQFHRHRTRHSSARRFT